MEITVYKFKTSLNCGNCVAKVQADLDQKVGINQWEVDTNHADKILTLNTTSTTKEEVINLIKSKGFKIEPLI